MKKNRLGFNLIMAALISIVCTIFVFFIAQSAAYEFIQYQDRDGSLQSKLTQKTIDKMQNYIYTHDISSDNIIGFADNHYELMAIYHNNTLLYDATQMFPQTIKDKEELWCGTPTTLYLKDSVVQVYTNIDIYSHYYLFVNTVSLLLSAITFIIIFYLFIRNKIRYVIRLEQEMHILEGGDLTYPITVKGKDELGDLANSINCMRVSFIERQKNENEAVQNSKSLITAISHDLRTPLTSLLGYLELLNNNKYKDKEQLEKYINISRDKALRIKEMTDQLFNYTLSENEIAYDLQDIDAYEFLQQILSEFIYELEESHFTVTYQSPVFLGIIKVDVTEIVRVFENILSNLKKYAHNTAPIIITVTPSNYAVTISIENQTAEITTEHMGTGIGLKTCKRILEGHDANIVSYNKNNIYKTSITLPMKVD